MDIVQFSKVGSPLVTLWLSTFDVTLSVGLPSMADGVVLSLGDSLIRESDLNLLTGPHWWDAHLFHWPFTWQMAVIFESFAGWTTASSVFTSSIFTCTSLSRPLPFVFYLQVSLFSLALLLLITTIASYIGFLNYRKARHTEMCFLFTSCICTINSQV